MKIPKLICIEGNIGVGKTTLTKQLADSIGALTMFEPVESNPYLERYYANRERYALEMQFWLMSRRFEMHETAIRHVWQNNQSIVMDRSIYGDWVFARKNWHDGNIDDEGYKSYMHHREGMDKRLLTPHITVFLELHPLDAFNRIRQRGRECEKGIELSYLQGLDTLHRELAIEMEKRGSRVIRMPWNDFNFSALVEKVMEV